jgi:hypothetical protein
VTGFVTRSEGSSAWVWTLAWLLGPTPLAYLLYKIFTYVHYDDVLTCYDRSPTFFGVALVGAVLLLPTLLLVSVASFFGERWIKPAVLTLSCALAVVLFLVVKESIWPIGVDANSDGCSFANLLIETVER